ncbi:hypothetical protein OSB04_007803 [Centaurea solstitialis]|uniref:Uncharacterized protein n=1 Tax=Centaurea solstitialis TaxID=347529 RepID=A0AA38U531_9ASTR|nr:hypothetical protein OSB04_007803 [Centaurea solstitialis]
MASSSSSSAIEVSVFIDTSLGTHIAISISPDLTAADFKRKFESVHLNCYPGIGNIKVDSLMTDQRAIPISKTIVTNVGSFMEPTNDRLSGSVSVSVSGIINKYFSVCDEVTSAKSKPHASDYIPATPMPSVTTNVRASRNGSKSSGVGKRLILAANNLGVSTSDKKPMVSLCRSKCDKSPFVVRHPIFEIGEG